MEIYALPTIDKLRENADEMTAQTAIAVWITRDFFNKAEEFGENITDCTVKSDGMGGCICTIGVKPENEKDFLDAVNIVGEENGISFSAYNPS